MTTVTTAQPHQPGRPAGPFGFLFDQTERLKVLNDAQHELDGIKQLVFSDEPALSIPKHILGYGEFDDEREPVYTGHPGVDMVRREVLNRWLSDVPDEGGFEIEELEGWIITPVQEMIDEARARITLG